MCVCVCVCVFMGSIEKQIMSGQRLQKHALELLREILDAGKYYFIHEAVVLMIHQFFILSRIP